MLPHLGFPFGFRRRIFLINFTLLLRDLGYYPLMIYMENIYNMKTFEIQKKYQFLDNVFLKVIEKNPEKMPAIFFKMFNSSSNTVIKFLSNKSNILEDFSIILKMPKWIFIKALF